MTKVEELRDEILSCYTDPWQRGPAAKAIDDLIAASRAEGAERGVAAERAALRANSGFLAKGSIAASDNCFDDVLQRESGEFATVAVCDCYITPADVLAPATKDEVKP